MIERLCGIVVQREGGHVILDVAGVGYGIDATDGAVADLVDDAPATLWIYTDVRDDAIKLFGFVRSEERTLFTHLISAPGVGAKLALAMLTHLGAGAVVECVLSDDAERLKQVPGIAAKAKEIQLHLKRRLGKLEDNTWLLRLRGAVGASARAGDPEARVGEESSAGLSHQLLIDLRSALTNLGYKDKEVQSVLARLASEPGEASLAGLLRRAVALLSAPEARRVASAKIGTPSKPAANLDEVF